LSEQDDPDLEVLEPATQQIQAAYAAKAEKELAVSRTRLEESCNTIQTLLDRSEQAGVAARRRKAQCDAAEDERDEMAACVKELEAEVERLKQVANHGRPTEPRPMAPLLQRAATSPSPGPSTSAGAPVPKHPYDGRDEALARRIAEVNDLAFDEEWDEEAEFDKEVEREIAADRRGGTNAGRRKGKGRTRPTGSTTSAPAQYRGLPAQTAPPPAAVQERPTAETPPPTWGGFRRGGFQRGAQGRTFLASSTTSTHPPASSRAPPGPIVPGNWVLLRNQHWLDQGSLISFTRWNTMTDTQIASVFSQERQWETGDIT
jgi:hypothetical protein